MSNFLNKIKTSCSTAFSKMGPLAAKVKPVAIVIGKAIKRAAIASWNFVKTPQGMSICLISALTVASSVVLSVRLYDYTKVDEREVLLKSDLQQEVDLFSVSYQDESGNITVMGADGQDVIAPGTAVEYTMRFRNKDKVALDYVLIPNIEYTSENAVPILIRMLDNDGNYIVGDAKTWVTVEDFVSFAEKRTLVKGESVEYIFEWKWEFESGDDEYDTLLGNTATEEDFGVEVSFELYAEANTEVGTNGGVIKSGLGDIIFSAVSILVLGGALSLMIIITVKKKKVH